MKVAAKFAFAFLGCGILSVGVYSSVAATREVDRLESTVVEDLASLGETVSASVKDVWVRDGEARALELVSAHDRANPVDIRWTWLDVGDSQPSAPLGGHAVIPKLLRGESPAWVNVGVDGTRRVYAYVPLLAPAKRPAALELSRPLVRESVIFWGEIREQIWTSMLVVAFATALALALTAWIISRPLARVAAQARRIGKGDLTHRLPEVGSDEVSALVRELNAMCDQLIAARTRADEEAEKKVSALAQLRHADRLRTVGTLASGIAHELGTPLNVIAIRAKMIASGEVEGPMAPENARIIASQADRVTKIVRQLLDFARRKTPDRAAADLSDIAERTIQFLGALAKKAGVDLATERSDGPVTVSVDRAQIEQAITNLVVNGIHAMSPPGEGAGAGKVVVRVRSELAARPAANGARAGEMRRCGVIEVEDNGRGIEPAVLEHIFEPFFTTKGIGEGTGLGLSVTHGIVTDHGGWLLADSTIGLGSRFSLYLPKDE